jgi:hypothetical protein
VQLQKAGEENMLDERGSIDRGSSDVGSRLQAVTQAMIALESRSGA